MIVILCDGSSKGNPGPASIGALIWDRNINARRTKPIHIISEEIGIATNRDAEWQSLIRTLDYVAIKYPNENQIYCYTDSQLVAYQASGRWNTNDEKMFAYKEAFLKLSYKKQVEVNWIPRQLTVLADKEAERAHNGS